MWEMYINDYELLLVIALGFFSVLLLIFVGCGVIEFRKANKEFEEMLRERQKMNNQLKNKL